MPETRNRRRRGRRRKRNFIQRWKHMSPRKRQRYLKCWGARLFCLIMLLLILFLAFTGIKSAVGFITGGKSEGDAVSQTETMEMTTEETTETVPEVVETEPVIQTLSLSAIGDCALGKTQDQGTAGSFIDYCNTKGKSYFFSNVRSVLEADDLTIANLECVLTDETTRVEKTYNIKGDPSYTGILTSGSVEAVSLGNNHSEDYGEQSRIDTEEALDKAGIVWAIDDNIGYYTTKDGLTVGIISELCIKDSEEQEQILLDGIQTCKDKGVNLIVCCCHWGIEKKYYPSDKQTSLAHKLIDAGADLILGCHPHVLQGIELYNGKMICYSLGNFCFGGNKNPSDKDTIIYQQTFTFSDGVLQDDLDVNIIPARVSSETQKNNFKPMIAKTRKQTILDEMNRYSAKYSDISFDEEGNMIVGDEDAAETETSDAENENSAEQNAADQNTTDQNTTDQNTTNQNTTNQTL